MLSNAGAGLDRSMHDTYYVVIDWRLYFSVIPIWIVLTSLIWFQSSRKAILYPAGKTVLFWICNLASGAFVTLPALLNRYAMPDTYVDLETRLFQISIAVGSTQLVMLLSFVGIIGLFLWSMFKHRSGRDIP